MEPPAEIQSALFISKSKRLSEILRESRISTYQICRIEEKINRTIIFHKELCNLTPEVKDFIYAFQWNTEISRWNRNQLFHCFKQWNYDFRILPVWDYSFSSSRIPREFWVKTSPKGLRRSKLVWVNVQRSNRWSNLSRWRNYFFSVRHQWTITY